MEDLENQRNEVRILKNVKISIKFERDIRDIITNAIRWHLYFDSEYFPPYLYRLLGEALQRFEKADGEDRVQLRRTEFLAVFHSDVMVYVDKPTHRLIRERLDEIITEIKDAL